MHMTYLAYDSLCMHFSMLIFGHTGYEERKSHKKMCRISLHRNVVTKFENTITARCSFVKRQQQQPIVYSNNDEKH